MKKIIASVLSDTIEQAQQKLDKIQGIVDWVQIDIMDGHFVSREFLSRKEDLAMLEWNGKKEAHLMVENPSFYFEICEFLNYDRVFFHVETITDQQVVHNELSKYSFSKGIVVNPETSYEEIIPFLDVVDVVLFMTVQPGKGGQHLLEDVLVTIHNFKKEYPEVLVEIDGGVNQDTISKAHEVGVDLFVVGTALFSGDDVQAQYEQLKSLISY